MLTSPLAITPIPIPSVGLTSGWLAITPIPIPSVGPLAWPSLATAAAYGGR